MLRFADQGPGAVVLTFLRRYGRLSAVAVIGGSVASVLNVPLPWLIGSIVAAAIFTNATGASAPPKSTRKFGQAILGATVALNITPYVLAQILELAPAMLSLALLSIATASLIALGLARWTGMDGRTTYFACMPGGVAEMSTLAENYGGAPALVALAQSLRIVTVVLVVPVAMHLASGWGSAAPSAQAPDLGPIAIIAILALSLLAGLALDRFGVLNSWFLGSMAVAGLLAASESVNASMPGPVSAMGQILIGVGLGARLESRELGRFRSTAPIFVLTTLVLITVNSIIGLGAGAALGLDAWTMVLALAPGGVAEMSITADALGAVVAIVAAFHLVRIVLIVTLTAVIYRRVYERLLSVEEPRPGE